jgi:signal transduction histidine kinase
MRSSSRLLADLWLSFIEPSNDHMEVRVVDSGQGISPVFLPHVFERFRQADDATVHRIAIVTHHPRNSEP